MATLQEDVMGMAVDQLMAVREEMLDVENVMSKTELVDLTIKRTAEAIEETYELKAKGVCEPNGDPHYSTGLGLHYWNQVSEQSCQESVEAEAAVDSGHPEKPE